MNDEVLDRIAEDVNGVIQAIGKIDDLTTRLETDNRAIAKLTDDLESVRANRDNLEMPKRATRLSAIRSSIELAQSDTRHVETAIADAQSAAIKLGRAVRLTIQTLLWTLQMCRQSAVESLIRESFNFDQVQAPLQSLVGAHRSIIQVVQATEYFTRTFHDASEEVDALRQLPAKFEALKAMCEAEPDLVLNPTKATPVVEPAVAELATV